MNVCSVSALVEDVSRNVADANLLFSVQENVKEKPGWFIKLFVKSSDSIILYDFYRKEGKVKHYHDILKFYLFNERIHSRYIIQMFFFHLRL